MNQLILPLALVLAFLAVATLSQAVIGAALAQRAKQQRVNRRMTLLESGMNHKDVYEALIRRDSQAPKITNASLLDIHRRATRFLNQAGLDISPFLLVGIWLGASIVIWLTVAVIIRSSGAVVGLREDVMSLVGGSVLVGNAIWIWVSGRRRKRLKILEEQLPLALDIVIRSLRAGHPVVSALQLVTTEMGDPIGTEFGLIVDETTYGYELKEALVHFARRTGSDDAHFFAVSVSIQSETGGNLGEILENLSRVIRARITLAKRVKALSSEGRMSAMILSGLPIFLISFLGLSQPSFYTEKFGDPIFWPVVMLILGMYLFGLMMMHRITNFKY
jgi:tight adherence protein B